jgi:hypothetical protein
VRTGLWLQVFRTAVVIVRTFVSHFNTPQSGTSGSGRSNTSTYRVRQTGGFHVTGRPTGLGGKGCGFNK